MIGEKIKHWAENIAGTDYPASVDSIIETYGSSSDLFVDEVIEIHKLEKRNFYRLLSRGILDKFSNNQAVDADKYKGDM